MWRAYKLDSKGKIRIWQAVAMDGEMIESSGILDGNLVEHRKMAKPKNVGKANATDAHQQATAELEAKFTKKLREGYFKTIEEAKNTVVILPMLAKTFGDHEHKIEYPCYVQPKLDGMRCTGDKVGLTSRKGVKIDTMDHILHAIQDGSINIMFDGELYAHGKTFQENMKLIKKYRKGESEDVKFHIYDMVGPGSFIERYEILESTIPLASGTLEIVPTFLVNNKEEIEKYHAKFLAEGYEGTIVRWGKAEYKANGRSENLLKYKDFKDVACEIVDIVEMDGYPDQGLVVCLHNQQEFKATPKMSHEEKRKLLRDKDDYIGQTAEIRYFEETDGGLPRFPVCVGFRLDK